MASDMMLRDLKATVDYILAKLQATTLKQDDILSNLVGKIDLQNQRLGTVEADVKHIKAILTTDSNPSTGSGGDTGLKEHERFAHVQIVASSIASLKEDVQESLAKHSKDVRAIVNEGVAHFNNMCVKYNGDVIKRLNEAKDMISAPISAIVSDVKQSVTAMDGLDKGISAIQNTVNQYSQTLKDVQEKSMPKEELNATLNALMTSSKSRTESLSQTKSIDDLVKRVDLLTMNSEQQLSALSKIHNELGLDGVLNRKLSDHHTALLDQLLCESYLTREIVRQPKQSSFQLPFCSPGQDTYNCDFFVTGFSKHVGSGINQHSRVWFVDKAQSYLKGVAVFSDEGILNTWIASGWNPRVMGLQIQKRRPKIRVKVSVVREGKRDCGLGREEMSCGDEDIAEHSDGWLRSSGVTVAKISCRQLKDWGYIDDRDRILLRYNIEVL